MGSSNVFLINEYFYPVQGEQKHDCRGQAHAGPARIWRPLHPLAGQLEAPSGGRECDRAEGEQCASCAADARPDQVGRTTLEQARGLRGAAAARWPSWSSGWRMRRTRRQCRSWRPR